MNWNKAKTLLIVLLVLLNAFLFVHLKKFNKGILYDRTFNTDVMTILSERGVIFDVTPPETGATMELLHLGEAGMEKETLLRVLLDEHLPADEETTVFDGEEKKLVFLNKQFTRFYYMDSAFDLEMCNRQTEAGMTDYVLGYLTALGQHWNEYKVTHFQVDEQSTEMMMMQVYQGNAVFDNFIHIIVRANGTLYIEASCYRIHGLESDEQGALLKTHQVLLRFFTPGAVTSNVVDIEQGFKKSSLFSAGEISEEQIGLCWRVELADGSVRYISLMSGQEVK